MRTDSKYLLMVTTFVTVAMMANSSIAQDSPVPSKSVDSFQNWTVECSNIAVVKKPKTTTVVKDPKTVAKKEFRRICEAIQSYTNKKSGNEVARLAFGIDSKDKDKLVAGMRVLVDASFSKSPVIKVGETEVFKGKFERCAGKYCFISFSNITSKNLAKLETSDSATIQYPIARGQLISIKVSTKGLSDSLKALKTKGNK